jgi:DNA-binding response OmpR family regulator
VRELLLRAKAILRRSSPDVRPVTPPASGTGLPLLAVGDPTLNCSDFQLSTPQTTVQLKPVEFDLLSYLMTHPGQVFSCSQLLVDLWGYPGDAGSPDLVRVHIWSLRRMMGADSNHPRFIQTVSRHACTVSAE